MNPHSSSYDVAIIGGGVIGCAIARELSRYELKTVVIEKEAEVGFGTTKSNSGIIHAGHQSPAGTLKGTLEVRGNGMFDRLRDELGFAFSRIGELVVAMVPEDLPVLEQLKKLGESRGVPGLEIWDKTRLQREEPNLSKNLLGALYAPTAGVINPYEFVFSLIESALANGVTLEIDSPVEKIDVADHGLILHTPRKSIQSCFVLNCAGVFADKIAQMAGACDFAIRPRKGEEYMLDKRLKGLVRRLIFPVPQKTTKGTLIIPTFDGTIMVGPTARDVEDREDIATTYEGSDEIFSFVRRLCPSIGERDTITEFAGMRAVSNTNDFIIGPTKVKGFINIAGIQSPGLTASPAIAEYVVDILKKEGLAPVPKKNCHQVASHQVAFKTRVTPPARFALRTLDRQKELIEKDRRFARVVCRCELVTEAEIHEAIDHGARTLDGIKFRSRAGMGRCQGGFCTSRCIDILSKRLACPPTAITKRGGGSWIIKEME